MKNSHICHLLNGCKSEKIITNLKNIFYEDKEMQVTIKKYYQIKRNLIISSIFSENILDTEL